MATSPLIRGTVVGTIEESGGVVVVVVLNECWGGGGKVEISEPLLHSVPQTKSSPKLRGGRDTLTVRAMWLVNVDTVTRLRDFTH